MSLSRKIFTSLLLIIVTLPISSSIVFFIGNYFSAKVENSSKEIKILTLEKSSFTWVKMNKEISIQGNLFDVISFIEQDEKVVVTGFFDKEEDALFSFFNTISSDDKSDLVIKHQLLAIVFFPVPQVLNSAITTTPGQIEKQKLIQAPDTLLLHRASEIEDPPPNKSCLFI